MSNGKVRERGSLVCRALGRNGGLGAALGKDGLFRLPNDDPDELWTWRFPDLVHGCGRNALVY